MPSQSYEADGFLSPNQGERAIVADMGDLERNAEYNHLLGEIDGLPKVMPEDPNEIAQLIETFRAMRTRMSYLESLIDDAGDGYQIGKCDNCNRDQYQHFDRKRAVDSLGRTMQTNLRGIGGCECPW